MTAWIGAECVAPRRDGADPGRGRRPRYGLPPPRRLPRPRTDRTGAGDRAALATPVQRRPVVSEGEAGQRPAIRIQDGFLLSS